MNKLTNLKKFFVGSLAALTLVAAVACSGAAEHSQEPIATEPNAEQVSNVDSGSVAPTLINTVVPVDPQDAEPVETPISVAIPAAFDGEIDDSPIGDAVEVAPAPAPEVTELSDAQIVAAQENHLADLYEETVQSIVFITARKGLQAFGSGSGFVWDEEGHVVTNYHVVQGATELQVKFFNGREHRASIVAFDPAADLAVIKIVDIDHELVPISIGTSSELRPGQTAIALGNPFGEEFTMTTGIVSAVTRTLDSGFSSYSIPSVIQTDASINPGNSGGPLLDINGAVIGVNTQIKSETRQSSGVGFAVPVDLVKRVVPSLIESGEHTYALMGISGNEVNLSLRESVGLPGDVVGAYVSSVTPDGPADLAGIRGDTGTQFGRLNFDGDVIVSINSIKMKSMDDLIGFLALNTAPGDEIVVGVFRDGVETAIPMVLGARPSTT